MKFMKHIIPLTALLLSPLASVDAATERSKPNIIVILADDLGYADLGCQGSKEVDSPQIDSIAANGVRFTAGYVTAPQCCPSRAGLVTGATRTASASRPTGRRPLLPRQACRSARRPSAITSRLRATPPA